MDERTSLRYQLISAWCGPAFVITFVIFWGMFGHNIPNPSPAAGAADLHARFVENLGSIRFGFIMSMIIICLYMPWTALLTTQMMKVEKTPLLSYLQLMGGALTVMVVSFSAMFWVVAGFRPDQDPAFTQLMTDTGWLCIDLQYFCTTLQMLAAALVGLADKRAEPLFPRWVCYLTIWCGLSFIPASLTGVLKTGPFAWDGALSYYIPYFCWLCWFSTASFFMIKEVRGRMSELPSDVPARAPAPGRA